jgi:Zn-dependent peptidase ImmA (M78 family)
VSGSRRADALVAAAEALDGLQIDQSYVIDPFAAISQLGLTLSIAKLGSLLGAVVPDGTGGILITSERSPAIQRYTAAHEIGHWLLHERQLQVDGETEVFGRPTTEMEREAQLFAGYFLMPPALLNKAVSAYGLNAGRIAPEQVYRLSRDLDVSYEAAARRLRTDRLIEDVDLSEILSVGRMRAMQQASAGHRPADGLADMWDASSDEELVALVVEEHDEVFVGLPEQRLAGWSWVTDAELARRERSALRPRRQPAPPEPVIPGRVERLRPARQWSLPVTTDAQAAVGRDAGPTMPTGEDEASPAGLVEDTFASEGPQETPTQRRRRRIAARALAPERQGASSADRLAGRLVGGTGVRTLVVRTDAPGDWKLRLHYAHAYDPRPAPLLTYELQLKILPTPNTAFRIQRLSSDLDQRLPGDPDDDAEFHVA